MIRQDRGAPYEEGWEPVGSNDLHVGDEVVVERRHFEFKKGYPIESTYYRTIVGEHRLVGGMAFRLTSAPSFEFPDIPKWQQGWCYAGNGELCQMWRRTET